MDQHRTRAQLEAGLAEVRRSPAAEGPVLRIVRRPATDQREVVPAAALDPADGMVGDSWKDRGSGRMPDGSSDPEAQLTIMNSRFAALVAGGPDGWEIAGDQLYVDLDLGVENLPPGTRLAVGSAVVQVSEVPHTGCVKFSGRFGPDALRLTASPEGRSLRLRGVNTRIVQGGEVRVGDTIRRLERPAG
jgi:hypothetical protein